MPTKRHKIETYLTDDEKARLDALTARLRLSRSDLLRRLVLGQRLPSEHDLAAAQAIRDLLKVNADQARLGNLMKLALTEADGAFPPATAAAITALLAEIATAQASLRATAQAIHAALHPRAGHR